MQFIRGESIFMIDHGEFRESIPQKLTETLQQSSWEDSITPDNEIAAWRIKTLVRAIIKIDSVSYGHCTKWTEEEVK